MTTLLNGLLGGLVVGALAAVATRFVDDDPSATAAVLKRAPSARGSSRWAPFAARLLYGALAGFVLVALELYALRLLGVPPTAGEAFAVALAWSALLFVVAGVVWRGLLSRPSDPPYIGELLAYHLVFGVGFGAWIRLTWIT